MDYKFLIEATANRERVREVKFVFFWKSKILIAQKLVS